MLGGILQDGGSTKAICDVQQKSFRAPQQKLNGVVEKEQN